MNGNYGDNAKKHHDEIRDREALESSKHEQEKEQARREALSPEERQMEDEQSRIKAMVNEGLSQQEIEDQLFEDVEKDAQARPVHEKDPDQKMREMAEHASSSGNDEAQAWLKLDKEAGANARHIKAAEREREKRQDPSYVEESFKSMSEAHSAYADHAGEGRPSIWFRDKREAFDATTRELKDQHNLSTAEHNQRMHDTSPTELEKLQNYIANEVNALDNNTQKRQSIAELPSEAKAQVEQVDVVSYLKDLSDAWKPSDMKQETQAIEDKVQQRSFDQKRETRQAY